LQLSTNLCNFVYMKMTNEYIAGFFDGEGTIIITKNKVRPAMTQTNESVLLQIKEFVGVGCVTKLKKRKPQHKDAWGYFITGNDGALILLKRIEPFLIVKKDRAITAINILEAYFEKINKRKEDIKQAVGLIKTGLSYREIEKITGIGRQTICKNNK